MPVDANYFRSRAAAYRQQAFDAKDDRVSGDLHEIAAMFNRIADAFGNGRTTALPRQRLFFPGFLLRIFFAR